MALSDCIKKFADEINIGALEKQAKAYIDEGMSPDTAMVRAAKAEADRLNGELDSIHKIAGVKQEVKVSPETQREQIIKEIEQKTDADYRREVAREAAKNDPEQMKILDEAEAEYAQDKLEASLLRTAAQCIIGGV